MSNEWTYKGAPFPGIDIDLSEWWGFVYMIEHVGTGIRYVGKKFFTKAKTRQVKGKKKKYRATSDWENYWGSSDILKENIEKNGTALYTRTILHLCRSKAECSYYEVH